MISRIYHFIATGNATTDQKSIIRNINKNLTVLGKGIHCMILSRYEGLIFCKLKSLVIKKMQVFGHETILTFV